MKKSLLAIALVAAAGLAQAETGKWILTSQEPDGSARFDLYSGDGGLCTGRARFAMYVPKNGTSVRGCWYAAQGGVIIVFTDGDRAAIPIAELKEPEVI